MLVAIRKAPRLHPFRRLYRAHGILRIRKIHWPKFRAKKTTRGKSLEFFFFANSFESLPDVNERRDDRILWTQHLAHPSPNVRSSHRERRNISGMPMILMTGMQNVPEVGLHCRPNQSAPVHHLGDLLHPFSDLDVVHRSIDSRESAQDLIDFQTLLIGKVAFRIKGIRRGHSTGEPNQNTGIGLRLGMLHHGRIRQGSRSAPTQCGQRSSAQLFDEISSRSLFFRSHHLNERFGIQVA